MKYDGPVPVRRVIPGPPVVLDPVDPAAAPDEHLILEQDSAVLAGGRFDGCPIDPGSEED